jgi:molybdopterin synthase catalytic subunit
VHRLGRLEIGETSVVISVAAPHRKAAFAACEWLIRELKRTVPIWKKEVYADGEQWIEGENTPAKG